MDQKHKIEDIFLEAGVPTTNLQATMFMEELWKRYTRPHILKVRFLNLEGRASRLLPSASMH